MRAYEPRFLRKKIRVDLTMKKMVLPAGIEPATAALLARRSNQLSYGSFCNKGFPTTSDVSRILLCDRPLVRHTMKTDYPTFWLKMSLRDPNSVQSYTVPRSSLYDYSVSLRHS